MLVIDFKSKQCRISQHSLCHRSWTGLGFQCACECICHKGKNIAIVGVGEPAPIAIGTSASEVSKEDD